MWGVEMEQRMERLETDMTDVKTRLAVAVSNIKEIREYIGGFKDTTTWILRLLLVSSIGFYYKRRIDVT